MSGFVSVPKLPEFDSSKPVEQQWKELTRTLTGFFGDVQHRLNSAFMKDGSEPMKVVTTTLPAGTTYFEGMTRSDTMNAYLDAGNWRSWDTARPSWRIAQDMSNDRIRIDRAAAATGNLTWTTTCAQTHSSGIRLSANQSIPDNANTVITFDQIDFEDISGFASLASNGFTAPVTGTYETCASLNYTLNGTGVRGIILTVNGAYLNPNRAVYVAANGTVGVTPVLVTRLRATAGQVIRCEGYQNSGIALDALQLYSLLQCTLVGY